MKIGFIAICLMLSTCLFCLQVGGHITSDTTWSPEYNPYEVIHNVYVDSGVTLTIQPGTIVKFHAALSTYNGDENNFHFDYVGGESLAKMIYAFGEIVALGAEADSITFTRYEEAPSNMRWGNIIFSASAPKSTFRHCRFMYSHNTHDPNNNYFGALCSKNGRLDVSYCRFLNCDVGVFTTTLTEPMLIHHNLFQQYERPYQESWLIGIMSDAVNTDNEFIFAYNEYYGLGSKSELYNGQYYPNSQLFEKVFLHASATGREGVRNLTAGDAYGNEMFNTNNHLIARSISMSGKGYVKRNRIVNSAGIMAIGYMDVCDNVMINSDDLEAGHTLPEMDSVTDVYNNRLEGCRIIQTGGGRIFNNVLIDSPGPAPIELGHHTTLVANNTVYNTPLHALSYYNGLNNVTIENNIFNTGDLWIINEWIGAVFRNNVMNFAVPALAVDGGGNLINIDPLFVNPSRDNYRLQAGSPCIDAGYDTTGYNAMDFDYYHRVVDGNNDGIDRIDIGAYEYGSSFPGGYRGHILFPDNTPVSLVKVDIEGVTREYTDSLGFFRFSAPAGTYALYAHHIFEGDRIFSVTITEGQTTLQDFVWQAESSNEDEHNGNDYPSAGSAILQDLHVFPNPFSSITNIAYTLKETDRIKAVVYNLRGEKVRTITDTYQSRGYNSIIWNGEDDNKKIVASGIYYIRLSTSKDKSATHKIVRIR